MKISNTKKGMTLIETLIYVSIFVTFIITLTSFIGTINASRKKNQINLEVNYQGSEVIRIINQTIQNATSTSQPALSNSGDTLVLQMSDVTKSPTIFSIASSTIFVQEGSGSKVALTNNKVQVKDLVFTNFSRPNTPGVIQVKFTMSNPTSLTKPEEQYSKEFYGGLSIKRYE